MIRTYVEDDQGHLSRHAACALGCSDDLTIAAIWLWLRCDEAPEVGQQLVVTSGNATELLELCKEAFDEVSFFINAPVAWVWSPPLGPWRDDWNSAGIQNGVVEMLGIIGPVGDDIAGVETSEQFFAIDHVTAVSWRKHKAHRQA